VLFNLVLAAYFVIRMAHPDGTDRTAPVVGTVFPTTLVPGETFTVVGLNLTGDMDPDGTLPPGQSSPVIKIDGAIAADVTVDPKVPDRIVAKAPVLPPGLHTLTVVNAWGVETPEGKPVQI
jgi:hypothetical protein